MKTKLTSFLTLLLVFVVQISFAQDRTISGTVSDKNGPLPGVNVVIKGTLTGVETNFDGNYFIKAKLGDTLVFSFVGMKTIKKVVESSNIINITMTEDANILNEVVVTALGIKRKPRELTASIAQLKSDDLIKTRAVNVTSAIVGKVSGLQITTGSGVNPFTRIYLRGFRSMGSNNQALIVIDGTPVDRTAIDRINPNDIENVTILKGSKSAALYGSEAANGVIVITTKRGENKLSVTYTSSLEFSSVAYLPKVQDVYGPGINGELDPLENVNWGPKYDGRLVNASGVLPNGDVWQVPYTPIKNRNENFFDVGTTIRHSLSVGGGDKTSDYYFSLDQTNTKGVIPKDEYNRTNVRVKASRTYKKLKIGANVSFYRSHSNTVIPNAAQEGFSIYQTVLNTPLHLPIDQLKNWKTGKFTRNEVSFFRYYENPYYIIDTKRSKADINEFNFTTQFDYQITDWLSATLRPNYVFTSVKTRTENGAFTYEFHLDEFANNRIEIPESGASVSDALTSRWRFNNDLLLTFNNKITTNFSTQLILGSNVFISGSDRVSVSGGNLTVPDFFHISLITGEPTVSQFTSARRKVGAYADLTLNYKDYLYLNATARNDWSSTLPIQNNSFFYPSIGLSFIASDAFPKIRSKNGLSYLKTSISWAKTGNDAATPFRANNTYIRPTNYGNIASLRVSGSPADLNLKPEFTTSIEAGVDYGLFSNRITGSINVYKTNTTDQILTLNIPTPTGADTYFTNAGEMESKGLELDLAATIIKNRNLNWRVSANYTTSNTKVISLYNGVNEFQVGGISSPGSPLYATVGETFPSVKYSAYLRDPQGRIIVDDDGYPSAAPELQPLGTTVPNKVLGLATNLRYKNFSLYIAGDYRTGHIFFNQLAHTLEHTGLTQRSISNGRQPFVYPNSSYSDGNGGFIANTNRLTASGSTDFRNKVINITERHVVDASAWKIREISLSYDFDRKVLTDLGITNLTLSAYGRNLFMFRPSENVYTDPEYGSNSTPPTRQYGLTLNVKF